MTGSAIEPRPSDLGDGIVSYANGLEITAELSFNDWQRLGERLRDTTDRALWSLGDWRVYGRRFEKDYHDAIAKIDAGSRIVTDAERVADAIGHGRRRGQLSFEIHALVAGLDEAEQERWLDETERQGWDRQQLQFKFNEQVEVVAKPAISFRAIGELRELCSRAAAAPAMTVTIEVPGETDPKEWVALVLERAARAQTHALEAAA